MKELKPLIITILLTLAIIVGVVILNITMTNGFARLDQLTITSIPYQGAAEKMITPSYLEKMGYTENQGSFYYDAGSFEIMITKEYDDYLGYKVYIQHYEDIIYLRSIRATGELERIHETITKLTQ